MVALSPYGNLVVPDITLPQLLNDTTTATVPGRTDARTPVLIPLHLRAQPQVPIEQLDDGRVAAPDSRAALSIDSVREHVRRIAVSLLDPPHSKLAMASFPSGQAGTALAHQLSHAWPRGGTVALFSTNQHDYTTVVLGLQVAGAVPALCNPAAKPTELAHQLFRTQTKLIIASNATYETALEAARLVANQQPGFPFHGMDPLPMPGVLVFDEDSPVSYTRFLMRPKHESWNRRQELIANVKVDPWRDDALYCFSSGTSGLPKAIRISHRNLVANVLQLYVLMADDFYPPLAEHYEPKLVPWDASTVRGGNAIGSTTAWKPTNPDARHSHIDILPTFHAYGLVSQFVAIFTATPRVVFARFGLESFLETIQRYKSTFAYVVPPILLALAQHPLVDQYDVSSLVHVASGAAPLPEQIKKQVTKRIGTAVTDGWGLSEMTPIVSLQNIQVASNQPGGVGNLAPGTGARVIDLDTGKDVPTGTEGEIYLRGPQMMMGYLAAKATDSTFQGERRADDDGNPQQPSRAGAWLKTGDIGCVDPGTGTESTHWTDEALLRGQIRLTSRVKDVIKMNGFQVSPKELEDHLFDSVWVGDAAVVGLRRSTAAKRAQREEAGTTDPSICASASASAASSSTAARDGTQKKTLPTGLDALVDEVPWAFIVPTPEAKKVGLDQRTKQLLQQINGQVAGYKKLHGIEWVDELPKSSSGKILKRTLRDQAEENA